MSSHPIKKAILLPGNGLDPDDDMREVMWYGWMQAALRELLNIPCIMEVPPFPLEAYEEHWKAHALKLAGGDLRDTLVIGHSSGAACALRLMEEHKIGGCILVAAYNSDLGDRLERQSGYFSRPFDYAAMVRNAGFVLQFHAKNDHLVPVRVAREVVQGFQSAVAAVGADKNKFTYVEEERCGHFQCEEYPQFIRVLQAALIAEPEEDEKKR
jgi:predicted alpha/beta hydrolase family esterase